VAGKALNLSCGSQSHTPYLACAVVLGHLLHVRRCHQVAAGAALHVIARTRGCVAACGSAGNSRAGLCDDAVWALTAVADCVHDSLGRRT
jgi:hypothetical protein